MCSEEHRVYLSNLKRNKVIVTVLRIFILFMFVLIWEILARYNLINSFLSSSPVLVLKTTINLIKENDLIIHIWYTLMRQL